MGDANRHGLHLTPFFPHGRDIKRDMERVRAVSALVEARLRGSGAGDEARVGRLTAQQLCDLGEVTRLAGHMLARHEDCRDARDMLCEFVGIVNDSADSISELDGQIEEMMLTAEAAICRIRDAKRGMCGTGGDHERVIVGGGARGADPGPA